MRRTASYRREAAALEQALGVGVVGIEHVGSTSVPGLPARPILDLLVGLSGEEPSDASSRRLRDLGYRPDPAHRADDVKRGKPHR